MWLCALINSSAPFPAPTITNPQGLESHIRIARDGLEENKGLLLTGIKSSLVARVEATFIPLREETPSIEELFEGYGSNDRGQPRESMAVTGG